MEPGNGVTPGRTSAILVEPRGTSPFARSVNAGTSYTVTNGDGGKEKENGEKSSFGSLVEANGGLGVDGNTGGNEAWDLAWDLVGAASRKAAQVEIMGLLASTGMSSVKGTTRHSVCAIH